MHRESTDDALCETEIANPPAFQQENLLECGRPCLVHSWTTLQHGDILFLMYEFNKVEEEPEPQASGRRLGPPRKHTGAGLLDPGQYPPIRPRCFGCSQPLMVAEISRHILSCDEVSPQDLARFKTALAEFKTNPSYAREVVEGFVNRIRLDRGFYD